MAKTPVYDLEAVKRYNNRFDRLTVYAPKGTKERIQATTGESVSAYINRLINEDLTRREQVARLGSKR